MPNATERLVELLQEKTQKTLNSQAVSRKAVASLSPDHKLSETDLTIKTGYQRVVYQYSLSGTTTIQTNSVLCVLGVLTNEGTINNEGTLVVGGVLCP